MIVNAAHNLVTDSPKLGLFAEKNWDNTNL